MRISFDQGALLYEARGSAGFLIRTYQTNVAAAERQGLESLAYAKKHKQPIPELLVLDIADGGLRRLTVDDLSEDD